MAVNDLKIFKCIFGVFAIVILFQCYLKIDYILHIQVKMLRQTNTYWGIRKSDAYLREGNIRRLSLIYSWYINDAIIKSLKRKYIILFKFKVKRVLTRLAVKTYLVNFWGIPP